MDRKPITESETTMFEFRWADDGNGNLQLQQRTCKFTTDASGAFCGTTPWSDWDSVPIVRGAGVLRPVHNVFQSWDEREPVKGKTPD